MAPWKTSTAGSARSTSTNSNRRQACLEAALRGGFLISPPLPAQTRDIVRHSSLPLRPTSFAMRSLGGVQFEIEKRIPTPCNIARSGWKMLHSKSVRSFEFTPDLPQMNASIFSFPKRCIAKLTQTLKCQTKSRHRSWSRSFMYSSNASKSMRQNEDRTTRKGHPVGWLCNRLRVCESYLSHVLGSTAWPALAMLRNSEAAVNITSEAEFKAVSQES